MRPASGRSTARPVCAESFAAWVISIAARPSAPLIVGGVPARNVAMKSSIWRAVLPIRRGSRGLKSGSVQLGSSHTSSSRAPVCSSIRSRSQKIEPSVPTIWYWLLRRVPNPDGPIS